MVNTKTYFKREDVVSKSQTHANQVHSEAVDSWNFTVFTNNKLERNLISAFRAKKPPIKRKRWEECVIRADLRTKELYWQIMKGVVNDW